MAEAARDFIRKARAPDSPSAWTEKGTHDFVTEVDRGAEALIRDQLAALAPGSHVIGEELSPSLSTGGLTWIVDPLDGTTNFLHRFPAYAVSIAAAVDGTLRAGVVLHVPDGRCFHAAAGAGAWCNESQIRVSTITDPGHALIGTGFPFKDVSRMDSYLRQFRAVAAATSGIRRAGSAALDLCSVACGEFDGFWEQQLAPWDVAAGTLIVREAGGIVTDDQGATIGIHDGPVVAGNPAIHAWLMDVMRA